MTGSGSAAPSSGDTNPFTNSELQVRTDTASAAVGSPPSHASSGDTNPFSSGERRRLGLGADDAPAPVPALASDACLTPSRHLHPASVRIILESAPTASDPVSLDYSPLGAGTDNDQRHRVLLSTGSNVTSGRATNKLAIAQSSKYVGFTIQSADSAGMRSGGQCLDLHFRLFFDPGKDRMVILNMATKHMIAKDIGEMASSKEIRFETQSLTMLDAGSWAIFGPSGRHALDLSILPRRHTSISRGAYEEPTSRAASSKRPLETSQPLDPAKRGKHDGGKDVEGDDAGSTTVVFQAVPLSPSAVIQAPATGQADTATLVPLVTHPLEQLGVGDRACIIGPGGDEYVLTRGTNIMTNTNTKVFRAQHSQVPGGLAVVKVIRTPSHDVQPGASDPSAMQVRRAAEMWLREYKIHSKLSQHVSIK